MEILGVLFIAAAAIGLAVENDSLQTQLAQTEMHLYIAVAVGVILFLLLLFSSISNKS